jgi:GntR family transcriptional regulator
MDATDPDFWRRRLVLDESLALPLYHQLKQRLRSVASKLDSNDPLPSERELCEWSGVSRVTVRRALADLIQEGYLVARRGRGTFVAPRRATTSLDRPAGFTETMRRLGHVPSTRVVAAEETLDPHIGRLMELPPDQPVYAIERVRLLNGEPCMLELAHVPANIAPGLLDEDLTGSLYTILHDRYGVDTAGGTESIVAVRATSKVANLLQTGIGDPILQTVRFTRAGDGMLIEYTIRHARADMCSFTVSLSGGSELSDRSSYAQAVRRFA